MLAGYDYDKAKQVVRWPLREALIALIEHLKREALESYRHELSIWAALAPHSTKKTDPPKLPEILK